MLCSVVGRIHYKYDLRSYLWCGVVLVHDDWIGFSDFVAAVAGLCELMSCLIQWRVGVGFYNIGVVVPL